MISIDELFAADDWQKLSDNKQLVRFWRHIREASISDDRLLTFKEPFPFGECRGGLASTLYIRDSYEKLWKMIWEHERAVKFLVTGSPGTGKTLFLRYVMYRLAFAGVPIILQMSTNTSNLFLGENVYRCKGYPDHYGILSSEDTWYIVDSLEIEDVAAHSLMVSSPEVQKFKQYRKYRLYQEYYMPTWSLEELLTVGARLWSLSEQEIKERFYFAGGIPRHICDDWTLYKKLALQKIASLTLENFPRGRDCTQDGFGAPGQSHMIFSVEVEVDVDVTDRPFEKCHLQFCSLEVERLAYERMKQNYWTAMKVLLNRDYHCMECHPVGGLWEAVCVDHISSSEFVSENLGTGVRSVKSLHGLKMKHFEKLEEVSRGPPGIYKPFARNFCAVDLIVKKSEKEVLGIQMTMASRHGISKKGMVKLVGLFGKEVYGHYFLIREKDFEDFGEQRYVDSNRKVVSEEDFGKQSHVNSNRKVVSEASGTVKQYKMTFRGREVDESSKEQGQGAEAKTN